jgi:hypothetical protein
MFGWSILSILYSINYLSPWEITSQPNMPIDPLIYSSLFLITSILSLTLSICILVIGIKLRQGKPLGKTLYLLVSLLAAQAVTTGSELITFEITVRQLPILSGGLLAASILLLRRGTERGKIAAGFLIFSTLALYYLASPWEPAVARLSLMAVLQDNQVMMQILSLHFPLYAFNYLIGASQLLFTSLGLGVIVRFILPGKVFQEHERALRGLWSLAVFLFGVCFIIVGAASSYPLYELLKAELGATLDPLLAQMINPGFLEFETVVGIAVFAISCLAGMIITLGSVSGIYDLVRYRVRTDLQII